MRSLSRLLLILSMTATATCSAGAALAAQVAPARPAGGNGFSISIAASTATPAVGQAVTITATANADVGPTPYYISVYDQTAQTEIAVCGYGTTCSATVSQPWISTHDYQAYVGDYPPPAGPPGFVLASSPVAAVTWTFHIRL